MSDYDQHDNPWTARYLPLLTEDQIAERVKVSAQPVPELRSLPIELALKKVGNAIDATFVPNEHNCNILKTLLELAYASSCQRYTDRRRYLADCYAPKTLLAQSETVVCLTGPAGVGKSRTIAALSRLLPAQTRIQIDRDHDSFPLQSHISVSINYRTSENAVREAMRMQIAQSHTQSLDLDRLLFRNGISLIVADEFQRMTQSSTANTVVAKTLLDMSLRGVPLVYVANYSLCHKLFRRPQEERQRLLARPVVLLPIEHKSAKWVSLLEEYCKIAPDVFTFDIKNASEPLYHYTAGLGRPLKHLLILALRKALQSKGKVSMQLLEQAYLSGEYFNDREDVRAMFESRITNKIVRRDLCSPFQTPIVETESLGAPKEKLADYSTQNVLLRSAMSPAEKAGYELMTRTN